MNLDFNFKPGSLVSFRNRPWIVMPSDDAEVLLLKPLGGTEEETTGIFLPVADPHEKPQSYDFLKPSADDLGDFSSARLLYNAARLSFRNAAGPFRCLGKLSFRPRAYQMVPLVMALRQEVVRLFIADDVGVGKTIEALLIARELHERREISRFAVVCLPHLCDQWQEEMKNKFGIDAVVIRSGTAAALERQLRTHENLFRAFPFQVISIDYIKAEPKRQVFLDHCPELVIVDEAHTCARPAGANRSRQQRHHLVHALAQKENQHLILLTATPHSGKEAEFQSLLGLLRKDFENLNIAEADAAMRKELARFYIQRRRADVMRWLKEETSFPERLAHEKDYEVSPDYARVFNEILDYAREMVARHADDQRRQRYSYWDALALLRGVMSSPEAGVAMLEKKATNQMLAYDEDDYDQQLAIYSETKEQETFDMGFSTDDNLPQPLTEGEALRPGNEARRLKEFAQRLGQLAGLEHDKKAEKGLHVVQDFLKRGYQPVVFCRFIHTARYLGKVWGEKLQATWGRKLHIEVITSELDDELRKEKIALMMQSERRLLIATDCLSEGINLQEGFDAVLHYDLPWNPNRLEQREGRIDRFGQPSPRVEVALLYGSNNPMDGVVLEVLLRKAREIRRSIGISVPFPEDSETVMEAVTQAILLKPGVKIKHIAQQLTLFEDEDIQRAEEKVERAFAEAGEREKLSRSIFAHHSIRAEELEADLRELDEAIGDVKAVEDFVVHGLRHLGVQVDAIKGGYKVYTRNIPGRLLELLNTTENTLRISFLSPTPKGFRYIGRNHPFTEHLCQYIINASVQRKEHRAARAAVMYSSEVKQKTVLFQFRVRSVIAEQASHKQWVGEEMWLWGYQGSYRDGQFIGKEDAYWLLMNARPARNMEEQEKAWWMQEELQWMRDESVFRDITDPIALQRAEHLVESHTRFRRLIGGERYKVVEPVLPMDVLGVYILLPHTSAS